MPHVWIFTIYDMLRIIRVPPLGSPPWWWWSSSFSSWSSSCRRNQSKSSRFSRIVLKGVAVGSWDLVRKFLLSWGSLTLKRPLLGALSWPSIRSPDWWRCIKTHKVGRHGREEITPPEGDSVRSVQCSFCGLWVSGKGRCSQRGFFGN